MNSRTIKEGLYIGLMSGTSMDGVDVVISEIRSLSLSVIGSITVPYKKKLRRTLDRVVLNNEPLTIHSYAVLDVEIGKEFAEAVNYALQEFGIKNNHIIAVGSHGQTLRHSPSSAPPYSLQIGDGATIAALTNITCISNFRSLDIAKGGQGAPLVPAFHEWCFSSEDKERSILNIGGIANLTILNSDNTHPLGFDTGPGNCLMDEWTNLHLGEPYDKEGTWASSGKTIPLLLESLLDYDYFKKDIPKSTGREEFNLRFLREKITSTSMSSASSEDIQATLLDLSTYSITAALDTFTKQKASDVFVCGGGFYNTALIGALRNAMPARSFFSTEKVGYDPRFVEATAFSWLAFMRISRLPVKLVTSKRMRRLQLGAIHS